MGCVLHSWVGLSWVGEALEKGGGGRKGRKRAGAGEGG